MFTKIDPQQKILKIPHYFLRLSPTHNILRFYLLLLPKDPKPNNIRTRLKELVKSFKARKKQYLKNKTLNF